MLKILIIYNKKGKEAHHSPMKTFENLDYFFDKLMMEVQMCY